MNPFLSFSVRHLHGRAIELANWLLELSRSCKWTTASLLPDDKLIIVTLPIAFNL